VLSGRDIITSPLSNVRVLDIIYTYMYITHDFVFLTSNPVTNRKFIHLLQARYCTIEFSNKRLTWCIIHVHVHVYTLLIWPCMFTCACNIPLANTQYRHGKVDNIWQCLLVHCVMCMYPVSTTCRYICIIHVHVLILHACRRTESVHSHTVDRDQVWC
jgi:hypothetical protein